MYLEMKEGLGSSKKEYDHDHYESCIQTLAEGCKEIAEDLDRHPEDVAEELYNFIQDREELREAKLDAMRYRVLERFQENMKNLAISDAEINKMDLIPIHDRIKSDIQDEIEYLD